VNMPWLITFATEKEKSKAADAKNFWHAGNCNNAVSIAKGFQRSQTAATELQATRLPLQQ